MLALTPAVAFVLVSIALRRRDEKCLWREAFVGAALILATGGFVATEALSLFRALRPAAVTAYWMLVAISAAVFLWRSAAHSRPRETMPVAVAGEAALVRVLVGGLCVYVGVLAVIAFVAPPNTWDSMEYHLSKVMHWIQNGSVSFYPTHIPRQNHLGPGAEFAVLHLHLLAGSDRFANFPQWFSMTGSLVTVSLIAKRFGAGALGQCLAAVFVATLPMGVLQATSTQTDYAAAFWFVVFLYYFVRLMQEPAVRWQTLLCLAAALGLAVITKGTLYLFAPAFLLWLACRLIEALRWRAAGAFAAIAAVFLVFNAAHYSRNWRIYDHPLGPREEPMQNTKYGIESHRPGALLSNFSKHVGTHINTPWKELNAAIERGYVTLHQAIGWELNDPRTTWGPKSVKFSIKPGRYDEDNDGNPLHLVLAVACGVLVLTIPVLRRDPLLPRYALAIGAAFLFFAFYLKWHPWMSRLHHGLFVAAGPLVGVVLTHGGRRWLGASTAVLLLGLGVPWLLGCVQRPLLGRENIFNTPRERLYFRTPLQTYESAFLEGRDFLGANDVTQLGLFVDNSSWEYMWWVFLQDAQPGARIEHVNVKDPSGRLADREPFRDFDPQAVLLLDRRPQPEKVTVNGRDYLRQWSKGRVGIYLKE